MKNPLYKRIPREFKHDFAKYIALFLFLTLTIGFVSGFLVADGSMKRTYDDSFLKYSIEDGHFTMDTPASTKLIQKIENQDVKVYQNYYYDKELKGGDTYRIYKNRNKINLSCVMEGNLPANDNEIAIDRLYAENNNISVGDKVFVSNKEYKISGFIALSDYSALFKNNTDMMFDAQKFTVAIVTDKEFDSLEKSGLHYSYSWKNNKSNLSEKESNKIADKIMYSIAAEKGLTDFVRRADNQAINFTGNDMGSDKTMFVTLLYIIIVVLSFVFAVTTKNTIEQESRVIGTLMASGYNKKELLSHYLILPSFTTAVAAIVGNTLGYSFMKNIVVGMYYGSYSLPEYKTIPSAEAFILTTVIPLIIIFAVNTIVISSALSFTPLQFLRGELERKKKDRAPKLPNIKFFSRFRLRIIMQNMPAYLTMFFGIFFASVILVFGMIMTPLLQNYKQDVVSSQVCNYQYILKDKCETKNNDAEKFCVTSLNTESGEDVMVYGLDENSKYFKNIDVSSLGNGVILSDSFMDKYSVKKDSIVTVKEKYYNAGYGFTVKGSTHYPASLAVFMTKEHFNRIFLMDNDYYNGYFSNEKLTDIDSDKVSSVITEHDMTIIADQLDDSMGSMFPLLCGFAVILYVIMIYLLAKIITEKNAQSISMVKVLGYTNREASRLYNLSTGIVVFLSLLISIPLSSLTMKIIYLAMMKEMNGWLTFYIAPHIFPLMMLLGLLSYGVVHILQMRKIKKVPMSYALKNTE